MLLQDLTDVLLGIKYSWAEVFIGWFDSDVCITFEFFQSIGLERSEICKFFMFEFLVKLLIMIFKVFFEFRYFVFDE